MVKFQSNVPQTIRFKPGDRLYNRYADLFGRVVSIDSDRGGIWIKYEWPYDPNADPELVAPKYLISEAEVNS